MLTTCCCKQNVKSYEFENIDVFSYYIFFTSAIVLTFGFSVFYHSDVINVEPLLPPRLYCSEMLMLVFGNNWMDQITKPTTMKKETYVPIQIKKITNVRV